MEKDLIAFVYLKSPIKKRDIQTIVAFYSAITPHHGEMKYRHEIFKGEEMEGVPAKDLLRIRFIFEVGIITKCVTVAVDRKNMNETYQKGAIKAAKKQLIEDYKLNTKPDEIKHTCEWMKDGMDYFLNIMLVCDEKEVTNGLETHSNNIAEKV